MYKLKVIKDYVEKNKKLPISEEGFHATVEVLLRLALSGARCDEIPLVLRYDFKEGKSSIKIIKTIFEYFKLIFKMKFSTRILH